MSEKELTNNNEEPNKAFEPETKLNKPINSIKKFKGTAHLGLK